jgi:hypothetical protein
MAVRIPTSQGIPLSAPLPLPTRILTFRVYARDLQGFSPERDSVSVRGSFNSWNATPLFDATGNGIYSGNVAVSGAQGEEIAFKYVAVVAGEEVYEENVGAADPSDDRLYILGPSDVPTFVSSKPHIFGGLDPISPRGVRTGERVALLPISQSSQPEAPCHGWFFQNFVGWDGNGGIDEAGVVYSREPIGPAGTSIAPVRFARSSGGGVGEFSASNPAPGAGYIGAGSGLFEPGAIYFRAYAQNEAGATYGEQRQAIVPAGDYREWRTAYAVADVFVGEDSTAMEKRVALSWEGAQGVQGEWAWEIHRFESSQVDQNPSEGYRLLASFPDSEAAKSGSRRVYLDANVLPGWSYLYLIGIRDSVGLWAFRSAWVNVPVWLVPNAPGATAESQTPYSVTFAL